MKHSVKLEILECMSTEPMRVYDILKEVQRGRFLPVTAIWMVNSLNNLTSEGYIESVSAPESETDSRQHYSKLTSKGLDLLKNKT